MNYRETTWLPALRRTALEFLAAQPRGESNDTLLLPVLRELKFTVSRAQLLAELTWLDQLGLVTLTDLKKMHAVALTVRGRDVAAGYESVPGVAAPEA